MSWWDRELTIWWIHRTQRLRDDGDGNEEVHKGRARKLAAKIALQVRNILKKLVNIGADHSLRVKSLSHALIYLRMVL